MPRSPAVLTLEFAPPTGERAESLYDLAAAFAVLVDLARQLGGQEGRGADSLEESAISQTRPEKEKPADAEAQRAGDS